MLGQTYQFSVGTWHCVMIRDGQSQTTAERLLPAIPQAELQTAAESAGVDAQALELHFNVLYVDTGTARLLVDTGSGPNVRPEVGGLFAGLQALDISTDSITAIIISHIHGDHIGGLLKPDGSPAFPNARCFISQAEWAYGIDPASEREQARTVLTALEAHFTRVTGEAEVLPGVRMLPAPGHTPGHCCVQFDNGGETLLHIVDLAHNMLIVQHPDWSPRFDLDPQLGAHSRRAFLRRAADEGLRVASFHLPYPGIGRVSRQGDGFMWAGE